MWALIILMPLMIALDLLIFVADKFKKLFTNEEHENADGETILIGCINTTNDSSDAILDCHNCPEVSECMFHACFNPNRSPPNKKHFASPKNLIKEVN